MEGEMEWTTGHDSGMEREMAWASAQEYKISRLYGHVTGFYGDFVTPAMVTLLTLQVLALCFVRRKYEEYYGGRSRDFRALTLVVAYVDLVASGAVLASYVRNTGPLLDTTGNNDTCEVIYNPIYTTDVVYFATMLIWIMMCALIRRMIVSTFFARKQDPLLSSREMVIVAIMATLLVDIMQAYTNYVRIKLDTSVWVVTYYCKHVLARNTNFMMSVMFAGLLLVFIYLNFKHIIASKVPEADGHSAVAEAIIPPIIGKNTYKDSLQPLWYDEVIEIPSSKLGAVESLRLHETRLDSGSVPTDSQKEKWNPPTKIPCQALPVEQTMQECPERHLLLLTGRPDAMSSPNMPARDRTKTETSLCCQHRLVSVSALAHAGMFDGLRSVALAVLGETLLIFWLSSYTVSFYSMPYLKHPAVMAAISFLNLFSVVIFYLGRDREKTISRIPAYAGIDI